MTATRGGELPPERARAMRRAVRLEWISVVYFSTAIGFTALVMGQSQAMKTAWVDDILGLVPPISILVAARIRRRPPSEAYPYGYHRCVTIASLCGAVALLGLGVMLLVDGAVTLIAGERLTIGDIELLGRRVWLGWPMIAALLYSCIPTFFLGRIKHRIALALHDKALASDAMMNRADWMAGVAAILGVLGLGYGYWWADAVAGMLIALDISRDGVGELRCVVGDLMDRRPRDIDDRDWDPLPRALEHALAALPWVERVTVRLREHGHVYFGEVDIRPRDEAEPLRRIREARACARALDWRVQGVSVQLVDADADFDIADGTARDGPRTRRGDPAQAKAPKCCAHAGRG